MSVLESLWKSKKFSGSLPTLLATGEALACSTLSSSPDSIFLLAPGPESVLDLGESVLDLEESDLALTTLQKIQ